MQQISWDRAKALKSIGAHFTWLEDDDGYDVYVVMGSISHTVTVFKGTPDGTDFETNYLPAGQEAIDTTPAFASKKTSDGKSLFQRVHGMAMALDSTGAAKKFAFTVPYTICKITGVDVVNSLAGDCVDFKVLDTATGAYTTVPNYQLNQFGFCVYPSKDYYHHKSVYDADLFAGMQVEVTVTPVDSVARSLYANLILHEVK